MRRKEPSPSATIVEQFRSEVDWNQVNQHAWVPTFAITLVWGVPRPPPRPPLQFRANCNFNSGWRSKQRSMGWTGLRQCWQYVWVPEREAKAIWFGKTQAEKGTVKMMRRRLPLITIYSSKCLEAEVMCLKSKFEKLQNQVLNPSKIDLYDGDQGTWT